MQLTYELYDWQKKVKELFFSDNETLYLWCPRQNGKTQIASYIILLLLLSGRKICYTAHRDSVNTNIFNRLTYEKDKNGILNKLHYKSYKSNGKTEILYKTGGAIKFYVRSKLNAIGDTYDYLLHDEAEFMTAPMQSALTPTLTKHEMRQRDNRDTKIFYFGTAPRIYDDYTFFNNAKAKTDKKHFIFYGLGAVDELKPLTLNTAYKLANKKTVNPTRIHIDTIKAELKDLDIQDFYSQRLGAIYTEKAKRHITNAQIMNNLIKPDDNKKLINELKNADCRIGIKITQTNTSIAKCVRLENMAGEFVYYTQVIDTRQTNKGFKWITDFINMDDNITGVAIDGFNADYIQNSLEYIHKRFKRITGYAYYSQNSLFTNLLNENRVKFANQKGLIKGLENIRTEQRTNTTDKQNTADQDLPFAFRKINDDVIISPAEAVVSSIYAWTI
jgi:hypothetical protein